MPANIDEIFLTIEQNEKEPATLAWTNLYDYLFAAVLDIDNDASDKDINQEYENLHALMQRVPSLNRQYAPKFIFANLKALRLTLYIKQNSNNISADTISFFNKLARIPLCEATGLLGLIIAKVLTEEQIKEYINKYLKYSTVTEYKDHIGSVLAKTFPIYLAFHLMK